MRLHGLHENPAGNHATEMTEAGAPRGASPLVPIGECREGQPKDPGTQSVSGEYRAPCSGTSRGRNIRNFEAVGRVPSFEFLSSFAF